MSYRSAALSALTIVLALAAPSPTASGSQPPSAQEHPVIELEVVARQFEFSPSRVEVNQGDRVRILVRSEDKVHGFAIPKLKVERLVPAKGKVVTLEFEAKTAGTFEIICSESCGEGHKNMKGTLVVVSREKDNP